MKLLKILIATAWALSAALTSAAQVDPPSVVGRLNYISGSVSFAPAQANEDWVAATLNRPITTGDRLWTDSNGRAEIHVGSLAIRMAAQTSVDVLELDDRTLQLRVAQGNVTLRVRRLLSDRLLEIATPSAAVVVKQPGAYRISVDPSGTATMVAVRGGGQAEVFTGNSSFAVRDNEEAAISGGREDLFAAPPPDEFDRWAAGRDQREDRVASTRYIPDEMTGYEDLDQYGDWRTVSDYGAVWVPAHVPDDWAPYRYGHWVWISPWGWTWVDDAPWGFAPFHYGRWVWLDHHWAWAPGRVVARPVYSPAMVAFIGGANFSVSMSFGSAPAVAWVPLGWREPYIPWYRASHAHVQSVNVTHVTNVTNITSNVTNITYVNRTAPSAVTVVSRENFVAARQVQQASLNVPARTLAAAPVMQSTPVAAPARTSFAALQHGSRPPAVVTTREAVVVNTPPAPVRDVVGEGRDDRRGVRVAGNNESPRVRVINRQERVKLPVNENEVQRAATPATQSAAEAPRANAPTQSVSGAQRPQPQVERGGARSTESAVPQPRPNQKDHVSAGERAPEKGIAQPRPLPENRITMPRPESDVQRIQQQQQPQQTQVQQAREQQGRQQALQRQQDEQQRAQQQRTQQLEQQRQQQAQVQQAREQQARQQALQRQQDEQQRAQQQRTQQLEQQRLQQAKVQQAREQQARQQALQRQQDEQQRAQQQRTQQLEQQRQQQAQVQQAREQQARQQEQQRQQLAAQKQQAQLQQERRAQQQQRELQAARTGEPRAALQRAQESHEKRGRERPRAEQSQKD